MNSLDSRGNLASLNLQVLCIPEILVAMISMFSAVVLNLNTFGDTVQAFLLLVDTKKGE